MEIVGKTKPEMKWSNKMKQKKIIAELQCQNMNLQTENERLQNCYDNICSFKHDFSNIMQAIGGYIEAKDIVGLKEMYSSIIKECQEINDIHSINKDIINNPAIYTLINNKYKTAKELKINMKVEVYTDISKFKISDLNLCRILGILIDNAIEASKKCEEKHIYVKFKFDKLNNRNLVIVKNTYNRELTNVHKIFEKGYSTKKEKLNHGIGLWKVQQIIKSSNNLNLYTSNDELFMQQLEIYNK